MRLKSNKNDLLKTDSFLIQYIPFIFPLPLDLLYIFAYIEKSLPLCAKGPVEGNGSHGPGVPSSFGVTWLVPWALKLCGGAAGTFDCSSSH